MTQVIIYQNDNGTIAIVRPTAQCLQNHTIQEIAIKDVPAGKHFKIVDASVIPTDRTFRDSWTVTESELTDGVGGVSSEFEQLITE